MSVSTVTIIKNRIVSATDSSKIAIFKVRQGGHVLFDAVFDNTVQTQRRIRERDRNYIGSFAGKDDACHAAHLMRNTK